MLLPGFRTDVLGCIKGFDLFVHELGDRRARHVAARRDGLLEGRSSRRAPAAFRRSSRTASTGCWWSARRTRRWPRAIVELLGDAALRRRMGEAGLRARARAVHASSGWSPRPPRCTRAWPADPTQRTLWSFCARLKPQAFIIPRWQSAKSYFTGSAGSSRRSDAVMSARHPPSRTGVAGQPQAAADPDHVRVERHDQRRRRHARPHAEVERVVPHHPAQEQVEPLAGAAGRGPRKEIADARPLRHPAVGPPQVERQRASRKAVERRPDVGAAGSKPSRKNPSIDPLRSIICRSSHTSATRSGPRDPAVHEPVECRRLAARIEPAHVVRRSIAHDPPAAARSTAARWRRGRRPAPRRRSRPLRDRRAARTAARSESDRSPSRDS